MTSPLATALLLAWLKACALIYGVEPEFAWAVARVESGGPGVDEIRCGPLGRTGKYYGPFGIHREFRRRWPIDNPYVNVEVGVKALRGRDKRQVLKRYNASFDEAYYRAVMAIYRQAKREGKFRGQIQTRG
jgi:hypothetical protein